MPAAKKTAQSAAQAAQAELGKQGEALTACWLERQGWHILQRHWCCRGGELDLIALLSVPAAPPVLAFVEVKTRSQGSWDANGLMAITRRKQRLLWRSAGLYLAQQPQWAEASCRFDVALVACRRASLPPADGLIVWPYGASQYLVLQDYLENAFEVG